MGLIDRFTKDRVSKSVWSIALLVVALAFGGTFFLQHSETQARREDAARSAAARAAAALDGRVDADLFTAPTQLPESVGDGLIDRVRLAVFGDRSFKRLRIWASDGRLLFSSVRDDHLNSKELPNDSWIQATMGGRTSFLTAGGEVRVYVPLLPENGVSPAAAAEIDLHDSLVGGAVHESWLRVQLVVGAILLLMALLAIWSARAPGARIGAGVPFYPESVPEGWSVVDTGDLREARDLVANTRERTRKLEQRLGEVEGQKRYLEGELQRALSGWAPASTAATHAAVETPGEALAAERERAASSPRREARAPEERDRVPEPATSASPRPTDDEIFAIPDALTVAQPSSRRRRREAPGPTQPEPVAEKPRHRAPEPAVPIAPPASVPAVPVTPAATPRREPKRATRQEPAAFVFVPDADPAPSGDESHDLDAVALLERMVNPVGGSVGNVDPGDLRSRLARTASLKKPGSPERRAASEHPGEPPAH
jgi:hypothetical protein